MQTKGRELSSTNVVSDYSDGIPSISYCLIDGAGAVVAERDAHKVYYSASTIKLGVLIAAMQHVDAGKLDLEQPVISTQTFVSGIAGVGEYTFDAEECDAGMAPLGESMPLREVLRRMITVSSNEATNMAAALIGVDAVTAAMRSCGAAQSVMGRLFGDYAALNAGRSITTTAYDLAVLMRSVVSGTAAGTSSTNFMLEVLRAQEYKHIGASALAIDPQVDWGSKSGGVTGISHDVAFVNTTGNVAEAHVLAICTRAFTREEGEANVERAAHLLLRVNQVL